MITTPSIARFIHGLRALVILSVVTSLFQITSAFFSDHSISLQIAQETWSKPISSFGVGDRVAIFLILSAPALLWFVVLYQIWRLCSLYGKLMIFTSQNAARFKYIALAIAGMSIIKSAVMPLIGLYLWSRGGIPQIPEFDFPIVSKIDLLTAGVFFWLIAKIMEEASKIKEETELTI